MTDTSDHRIEPSPEIVDRARRWLEPVRAALGPEFVAAYLTGSVLTEGFDPKRSHVNLLVVARTLDGPRLDAMARALPAQRKQPLIEPLFLTRTQIEHSLDSFPIEWIEIQERRLRHRGRRRLRRDRGAPHLPAPAVRARAARQAHPAAPDLPAPPHRLRGAGARAARLAPAASPRCCARCCGCAARPCPPTPARVIQRVADLYHLDAQGLLAAHLFRYATRRHKTDEVLALYRGFLAEMERLIGALEELSV